jgi:hypothetical protein
LRGSTFGKTLELCFGSCLHILLDHIIFDGATRF